MTDLSNFVTSARKQLTPIIHRSGNVLYSAARTLRPGPFYLLGLNPGGDPNKHETIEEALDRLPSKESNAYVHETWERHGDPGQAPLRRRVRWLARQLGLDVEGVCAANLIPTEYQCCFCGKSIEERGSDPVTLNVPLDGGGTQQLPCHAACLRRALHPSVPLAV